MMAWTVWKEVQHREQHRQYGFKPLKMSNDSSIWASLVFKTAVKKNPKLVGLGIFLLESNKKLIFFPCRLSGKKKKKSNLTKQFYCHTEYLLFALIPCIRFCVTTSMKLPIVCDIPCSFALNNCIVISSAAQHGTQVDGNWRKTSQNKK